jgi:predicted kinase
VKTTTEVGPLSPLLICLAGLPASGKTSVAREVARALGAVHLRIDTIEQAVLRAEPSRSGVGALGYAVGYALAGDHLRQGLSVVADSVNPIAITRDAWREVALGAGAVQLDVEIVCSDPIEHERRATGRLADIPGHTVPTWAEIMSHGYAPWDRDRIVLDTATTSIAECVRRLRHLADAATA